MLLVAIQQLLDPARVQGAAHRSGGRLADPVGGGPIAIDRRGRGQPIEKREAAVAPRLDHEAVRVDELGEDQIVTLGDARPGVHRNAETGPSGLTAVDADHEDVAPAGDVVGLAQRSGDEGPILDGDGGEIAGARADQGDAGRIGFHGVGLEAFVLAPQAGQAHARREEGRLPRLRPDGKTEEALVFAADQAITPGLLLLAPAGGQVGDAGDVVMDDRAVAHPRTFQLVAVGAQRGQQRLQPVEGEQPQPPRRSTVAHAGRHHF